MSSTISGISGNQLDRISALQLTDRANRDDAQTAPTAPGDTSRQALVTGTSLPSLGDEMLASLLTFASRGSVDGESLGTTTQSNGSLTGDTAAGAPRGTLAEAGSGPFGNRPAPAPGGAPEQGSRASGASVDTDSLEAQQQQLLDTVYAAVSAYSAASGTSAPAGTSVQA